MIRCQWWQAAMMCNQGTGSYQYTYIFRLLFTVYCYLLETDSIEERFCL